MQDKLVIAGSRELYPTTAQISILIAALPDVVICGCANGVDRAGFLLARANCVPVEFFPAWRHHMDWAISVAEKGEVVHPLPRIQNRGAGYIRNEAMGLSATRALLMTTGTQGTANMRDICLRLGVPCDVHAFTIRNGVCIAA